MEGTLRLKFPFVPWDLSVVAVFFLGMGINSSHLLMTESLFHGYLYKPLHYWVGEFIPYYMEIMGV